MKRPEIRVNSIQTMSPWETLPELWWSPASLNYMPGILQHWTVLHRIFIVRSYIWERDNKRKINLKKSILPGRLSYFEHHWPCEKWLRYRSDKSTIKMNTSVQTSHLQPLHHDHWEKHPLSQKGIFSSPKLEEMWTIYHVADTEWCILEIVL